MPQNKKLFHTAHYEIIAARFREQLGPIYEASEEYVDELNIVNIPEPYYGAMSRLSALPAAAALTAMAIALAKRFEQDDDAFDPVMFLNRCSPDAEKYPLGELWDNE